MKGESRISQEDKDYICYLRGFAIVSIVFGHVGGYWVFPPFSSYLHICGSSFFFFLSGAVLYHSFTRSETTSSFFLRRYTNLLLPYYLICLVSLLVFVCSHQTLPEFSLENLALWLLITPSKEIMPFPLSQLWFLYTYVVLILFTPVYVYLYDNKRGIFFTFVTLFLTLSVVKYYDFYDFLQRTTLYKYLFYSIFFLGGMCAFSDKQKHLKRVATAIFLISLTCLGTISVRSNALPDLTKYFVNRDIVLVIATMLLVCPVVVFKDAASRFISNLPLIPSILKFFHRHTFSVYLLHTFCIYLVEIHLDLVEPERKDVTYGLVKFSLVLLLTSVLAVPFTGLSKRCADMIAGAVNRVRTKTSGAGYGAGILKP